MSGHSKWHSIRHKKASADVKRGKVFTKLIKEITIAARLGGGDLVANPRLRLVVQRAKDSNMPADNIDRAIKKGTGELDGVEYKEYVYEGYGPYGVAFIMDILTDNGNRTLAEIRKLLSKNGGNLGESGSVGWMFERRGVISIDSSRYSEDDIMEIVLNEGALDIVTEDDLIIVYTRVDGFDAIRTLLAEKGIEIKASELSRVPKSTIKVDSSSVNKVLNLMELLEDHDDVQALYSNIDFD